MPTSSFTLSRRQIIKAFAVAAGGLTLGVSFAGASDGSKPLPVDEPTDFAPDAFIRISPAGEITLIMPRVEMGQGTYTSIPMLIAEELEVPLEQIILSHAPPDDLLYKDPVIGSQITGASASTRGAWEPMRKAGAACRLLLVNAAALVWKVPTDECRAVNGSVLHLTSGRQITYGQLAPLAARLPLPTDIPLKNPKDFHLIGRPIKRLDASAKVSGQTVFGIDVKVPGMLFASVAACPTVGGRVRAVDDRETRAMPGVRDVLLIGNAVAVVAENTWAARRGVDALHIEWETGANAGFSNASLRLELEEALKSPGVIAQKIGDADKVFARGKTLMTAAYEIPFLAHATMEPMNCTVHVTTEGCEVWTGTQVPARAQRTAAEITGLPLEKVKVHNQYLGGGFGRRLEVDWVTQAVDFARQVSYPIKFTWTREEDIQHGLPRTFYLNDLDAELGKDGLPLAWRHQITGAAVMARYLPEAFKNGVDPDAVNGATNLLYSIPNIQVTYVRHETPMPIGKWRGVGPTHNVFVVESFIDELAVKAQRDPYDYRRQLLGSQPRALGVIDRAAREFGWNKALKPSRKGMRVGRGISVQFAFGSYVAQIAEVEVDEKNNVRVVRVVCAIDCGHVVNPDTIRAQMEGGIIFAASAALWGEITFDRGRIMQSNFHDYRVMRIHEAPHIETHILASNEAPGGVGEAGTSALFPAVANAVSAATGTRIRVLPIARALGTINVE